MRDVWNTRMSSLSPQNRLLSCVRLHEMSRVAPFSDCNAGAELGGEIRKCDAGSCVRVQAPRAASSSYVRRLETFSKRFPRNRKGFQLSESSFDSEYVRQYECLPHHDHLLCFFAIMAFPFLMSIANLSSSSVTPCGRWYVGPYSLCVRLSKSLVA